MDSESSDDGGLRHITLQRARPPSGRKARGGKVKPTVLRDDSSSCDSDSVCSPSFCGSMVEPPLPPPPPPPSQFSKGEQVEYITQGQAYLATVAAVDKTINPPSYTVCFTDGSERSTEESRLRRPAQQAAVAEPEPEPEPEPERVPEPQEKKEKKEKKKKSKKEKREQTVEVDDEAPRQVITEEERKKKKQLMPKACEVAPGVARIIPNTKLFGAYVTEKVSNRGLKHRRVMLLTSAFIVFAKENGEIRRVVEVKHLDSILVQEAVGGPKVVLQLLASSGEPDVLLAFRAKGDPRNTHATPMKFLEALSKICEAVPPSSLVPINNVTSTTDIKLLIRTGSEVEKPNLRTKLDTMTKEVKKLNGDSDGDYDEDATPEWKPDSASNACEACVKPFTLIRRRHHCRACGGLFCGPCSSCKIVVSKLGAEPVRCCEGCRIRSEESLGR